MSSEYHCPICKSSNIIDYGESFECPICKETFFKADIDEENMLSENDLSGIVDVLKLNDLKDKKSRKDLFKPI